jgi:predicted O-methyltransferase YrrM
MEITHPDIQQYAEAHTSAEPSLLKKINRDTHARVLMPRMLSGHLQGRLLSMMSHMKKPQRILEIGTYTGYSAICLAEGLAEGGQLITIDVNDELEDLVRTNIRLAGMEHCIELKIGDAADIVSTLPGPFDLVFIDADKENYSLYYDLIFNRVPLQGIIIADNVLWSGKVLQDKPDKDTRAIHQFNQKVAGDGRVEQVLVPVRDGLMVMRKVRD